MFRRFTNGCVALVQRYLPDPFLFCIILTALAFIIAMPLTKQDPMQMVTHWGNGIWSLLTFSMQMALVLVLGSAMATSPPIHKFLKTLASIPKTPFQSIVFVTFIALVACWVNWGFGLIVGAILAKEVAKQGRKVDYRLLIASAYSGFLIWHGGISGSVPLTIANLTDTVVAQTGGVLTESIPTSQTIFAPWNLIICIAFLVILPLVNAKMHPSSENVIVIDPALLVEEPEKVFNKNTPAEKLESSRFMSWIVVVLVLALLVRHFAKSGFLLDLNVVNLIFLMLGVLFHGTPIRYVTAFTDAVKGAGGILLQFPFYAGIMGIMVGINPATGASLAGVISQFFVSIANDVTFPLFSFLSAGIVNVFIPSGGGQWAVQGPIMMPAGAALGVAPNVTAMSIAWGDSWTNMIQPFWALPALGIAGLGARDIMGFCVIDLIVSGIIICLVFLGIGILTL